jgi:LDH2 family malate/lactate/ureidoglycolate dehydrogenase
MQTEQIKIELMVEKSAKILELVGSSKADALSVATSLVDAQAAGQASKAMGVTSQDRAARRTRRARRAARKPPPAQ